MEIKNNNFEKMMSLIYKLLGNDNSECQTSLKASAHRDIEIYDLYHINYFQGNSRSPIAYRS